MEWDNEKCLELIGMYEEKAELWQPDHKYHHNKLKKHDAWVEIATKMGVPNESAKGKINSLLASHRREMMKEQSSKGTGKGQDEVYRSKWFAYEALRFIKDKNKCKQTLSSPLSQNSHQETNSQVGDLEGIATGDHSDVEDEDNVSMKDVRFVQPPAHKRKKISPPTAGTSQVDRVVDILQRSIDRSACDVYGEHVGMKLKTYEKKTQAIVQHYINNILFDADMGSLQVPAQHQPMSRSYSAPPDLHHYNIQQQNSQRHTTLHSPSSSVSSNASASGLFPLNAEECDHADTSPATGGNTLSSTFTAGNFYSEFRL